MTAYIKIGKWMEAEEVPRKPEHKTLFWKVYGSDQNQIGAVAWHGSWRQYVYYSEDNVILSAGCMTALAAFIAEKNAAHKGKGRTDGTTPTRIEEPNDG